MGQKNAERLGQGDSRLGGELGDLALQKIGADRAETEEDRAVLFELGAEVGQLLPRQDIQLGAKRGQRRSDPLGGFVRQFFQIQQGPRGGSRGGGGLARRRNLG